MGTVSDSLHGLVKMWTVPDSVHGLVKMTQKPFWIVFMC